MSFRLDVAADAPAPHTVYYDAGYPAGHGGHNGLRSIIDELHTEKFSRLRIGIGEPGRGAVDHVLSKFGPAERARLDELLDAAADAAKLRDVAHVTGLAPATRARLGELLPGFASPRNPVDLTGALLSDSALFGRVLEAVAADEEADGLLVALPVAGLLSDQRAPVVAKETTTLKRAWAQLGCKVPYMGFNLLPLSVIPQLRLTDKGLVDVTAMKLVSVFD
mgnify:CR=1 FL=1